MLPKTLRYVLLFPLCFLTSACGYDITRQPSQSWFVPGRIYVLKQEMLIGAGTIYYGPGSDAAFYHAHPERRPSFMDFITAGTHLALKRVIMGGNFDSYGISYQAKILDGKFRGQAVAINCLLKAGERGVVNGRDMFLRSINEVCLAEAPATAP